MSDSFCVTINSCKENGDKATVGFVVATAALGSGKDTMVFLSTDGVWAASFDCGPSSDGQDGLAAKDDRRYL